MGRAGAGFLDSAMKFGYAKREGADVNAEPQQPVQSFHVDDEPNTNNENKHKNAINEFTKYNEANRITNHLILAYVWCFKLSGLIGSMGLVDVRKPPSTGTVQRAVLPPVVKHTVSVAELIGI